MLLGLVFRHAGDDGDGGGAGGLRRVCSRERGSLLTTTTAVRVAGQRPQYMILSGNGGESTGSL